jgi:hypothetical protein
VRAYLCVAGDHLDEGRASLHGGVVVQAAPDARVGYEAEQADSARVAARVFDFPGRSDLKAGPGAVDILDVRDTVRAAAAAAVPRKLGRPARHAVQEQDDVTDARRRATRSTVSRNRGPVHQGGVLHAPANAGHQGLYGHGRRVVGQRLQVRAHLGPHLLQQRDPERVQVALQPEESVRYRASLSQSMGRRPRA